MNENVFSLLTVVSNMLYETVVSEFHKVIGFV